MFHVPEKNRVSNGPLGSDATYGNNGLFAIRLESAKIRCIASDGEGWEHVSVSIANAKQIPNWKQMCKIKDIFWDQEDCIVQYHPPRSEYINCHPRTLHLWRPTGISLPRPPSSMVGPKEALA